MEHQQSPSVKWECFSALVEKNLVIVQIHHEKDEEIGKFENLCEYCSFAVEKLLLSMVNETMKQIEE